MAGVSERVRLFEEQMRAHALKIRRVGEVDPEVDAAQLDEIRAGVERLREERQQLDAER
jgi:hypothetical protein